MSVVTRRRKLSALATFGLVGAIAVVPLSPASATSQHCITGKGTPCLQLVGTGRVITDSQSRYSPSPISGTGPYAKLSIKYPSGVVNDTTVTITVKKGGSASMNWTPRGNLVGTYPNNTQVCANFTWDSDWVCLWING
jgi:hypothetical protein